MGWEFQNASLIWTGRVWLTRVEPRVGESDVWPAGDKRDKKGIRAK